MTALIPGSYDPITLGHVNVIERAAKIADRVYVAVMNNDSAKHSSVLRSKTYMLSMEERFELVKLSLSHIENVEVVSSCGMLIDLFDELSADVIIKGIRSSADLEYEMIHAKWNKEHNPRLETLFLPADDSLASISSTLVREYVKKGEFGLLEGIISPEAIDFLQNTK
jgi:pantetheine-phosphate adenylyltransferase